MLSLGGASLIQLREKQLPALQFYEQAKAAVAVARQNGAQLIVNDRVDIALAAGAHGVHLGQDDMPPEAARNFSATKRSLATQLTTSNRRKKP